MIYKFECLESTQTYCKNNLNKLKVGDAVTSKIQTAGYGRTGEWESTENNIYLSLIKKDVYEYSWLNTICAIHKFINKYQKTSYIKIPNDIYVGNRKIAGFIIEKKSNKIIIGIGINVNLQQTATYTSILSETNVEYDVDELAAELVELINIEFEQPQSYLNEYFRTNTNLLTKQVVFKERLSNKVYEDVVVDIQYDTIFFSNKQYKMEEIKLIIDAGHNLS